MQIVNMSGEKKGTSSKLHDIFGKITDVMVSEPKNYSWMNSPNKFPKKI